MLNTNKTTKKYHIFGDSFWLCVTQKDSATNNFTDKNEINNLELSRSV